MAYLNLALLAVVGFALVKSGESLRCYSCSSDMEAPCADYFNETQVRNIYRHSGVETKNCEGGQMLYNIGQSNQKAVCMKKKTSIYGKITYRRDCQFIRLDERVGACPEEGPHGQQTTEFCEYCDHDFCNGATSVQTTILSAVAPLVIFLLFRK